jgi:ankyrin repeat protein
MDKKGTTPYHKATFDGHLEICKCIIEHVSDKNPKDSYGRTPLHIAAIFSHLYVCKLICQYIVDKHPKDNVGRTPFDCASDGRQDIKNLFSQFLPNQFF